jgi:hypothetical protein
MRTVFKHILITFFRYIIVDSRQASIEPVMKLLSEIPGIHGGDNVILFLDVTSCKLLNFNPYFRATCVRHFHSVRKMFFHPLQKHWCLSEIASRSYSYSYFLVFISVNNRSTTDQVFCIRHILKESGSTMKQYISYS